MYFSCHSSHNALKSCDIASMDSWEHQHKSHCQQRLSPCQVWSTVFVCLWKWFNSHHYNTNQVHGHHINYIASTHWITIAFTIFPIHVPNQPLLCLQQSWRVHRAPSSRATAASPCTRACLAFCSRSVRMHGENVNDIVCAWHFVSENRFFWNRRLLSKWSDWLVSKIKESIPHP